MYLNTEKNGWEVIEIRPFMKGGQGIQEPLKCPHWPTIQAHMACVPGPVVGFVMKFLKKQRQEKREVPRSDKSKKTGTLME